MESSNSSEWQADADLLEKLMEMGIAKIVAENALFYTGNRSAEEAACYVFDNPDMDVLPSILLKLQPKSKNAHRSDFERLDQMGDGGPDDDDGYKMVFVVNTSLNMGAGKIAAQVAHAAVIMYRKIRSVGGISNESLTDGLTKWENDGEKKIVLRGVDEAHLYELEAAALSNDNLFVQIINDAGHTQVPAGSVTVLGIFGREQTIDQVTGKLPLL